MASRKLELLKSACLPSCEFAFPVRMLMQVKYALICSILALACSKPSASSGDCDAGNGGITLPDGFCARVYADEVGVARHLVVDSNGDVFVALEDADGSSAGTTRMSGELARGGVLLLR